MKIHTHNLDGLLEVLSNIRVPNLSGQSTMDFGNDPESILLNYKVLTNYFKPVSLENEHYFNLPEFKWGEELFDRKVVQVKFRNKTEEEIFFKELGVKPTSKKYIYYQLNENPYKDYEYQYTESIQPKYPIYVISKGRWNNTLTIDTLEEMGVDFYICIEPKEFELYKKNASVDINKVLVLPENFSEQHNGAVPVRNWVWEHSVKNGHTKHWQLDDNIKWFYRWNMNLRKKIKDGVFFKIMEDFSDRYENLGLVGCQYASFVPAILPERTQFVKNTRIYSCILINSELLDQRLQERWRGRYNDDTDLSLRVLSLGDVCTVNFNSLLSGKQTSGGMKGGMANMYQNHTHLGYQNKFDSLKEQWGDIVTLTNKRHKDKRPHHHIEYTKLFTQELRLKQQIPTEPKVNEYNMIFFKK